MEEPGSGDGFVMSGSGATRDRPHIALPDLEGGD